MSTKNESPDRSDMSPEAVLARAVAARGDIFPEWSYVIASWPELFERLQQTAAHLHGYVGHEAAADRLSSEMRELIGTPALCSKTDIRHAANHVRKMYRMGLTNRVILEAAAAFATASGVSTIANVACAILEAHNPDYTFGKMPEGGEPKVLKPFAELAMGRTPVGDDGGTSAAAGASADWQSVATIDPDFADVASRWVDYCLLSGAHSSDEALLGPGPRALVAAAAHCARGEAEIAGELIRRADAFGMTRLQFLDAIMAVVPMTGMATARVGLRAMQMADRG
jgi:alkylhydroperoxidase/carboxymuconolactone decarboxylase family protein YurZ